MSLTYYKMRNYYKNQGSLELYDVPAHYKLISTNFSTFVLFLLLFLSLFLEQSSEQSAIWTIFSTFSKR